MTDNAPSKFPFKLTAEEWEVYDKLPPLSANDVQKLKDDALGPSRQSQDNDSSRGDAPPTCLLYAIPISKSPEFGTLAQTGRITYSERISCDKDVPLAMVVAVA